MRVITVASAMLVAATACAAEPSNADIGECYAALEAGDLQLAMLFSENVQQLLGVPKYLHRPALSCLSETTGEDWQYVQQLNRFVPKAEVEDRLSALAEAEAERERLAAEAEAERARLAAEADAKRTNLINQRRCEVLDKLEPLEAELSKLELEFSNFFQQYELAGELALIETISTCHSWYQEDSFAALTNAVCNRIFIEYGVSSLEAEVPSRSRKQLLEDQISWLYSDLRYLDQGRLPEEVDADAEENLKASLILRLPSELRVEAENNSIDELYLMVEEYEDSLCN